MHNALEAEYLAVVAEQQERANRLARLRRLSQPSREFVTGFKIRRSVQKTHDGGLHQENTVFVRAGRNIVFVRVGGNIVFVRAERNIVSVRAGRNLGSGQ